jgi:3-oxoacyl-[acyl-carrier-protein] synthase-3
MVGREVFENGVRRMSEAIFETLETQGLTLDEIDLVIPHQANLRMLEAILQKTAIPADKAFINVVDHGNMASACLPVALDEARRAGRIGSGSLVLLVAFGSGFVWGSALLRF